MVHKVRMWLANGQLMTQGSLASEWNRHFMLPFCGQKYSLLEYCGCSNDLKTFNFKKTFAVPVIKLLPLFPKEFSVELNYQREAININFAVTYAWSTHQYYVVSELRPPQK